MCIRDSVDTEPGSAWWIADAEPYTVKQIVETVGDALRAEGFEVRPNSFSLPDIAGTVAEKIDTITQRAGKYITQFHVLGEMNKNIAVDVAAARAELGYDPQAVVDAVEGVLADVEESWQPFAARFAALALGQLPDADLSLIHI